ncbi:murein biosynthesis integral membrane protein MurJ [Longimicrobium sp.]|jgi:putative peptidoglycan lipid II flippase|uniref:murein biosynthesis integral membrane protein MurJ n=1 Tax=Longimicrobium sp. TaxID=2029185 RepID=UPI002EDA71A0
MSRDGAPPPPDLPEEDDDRTLLQPPPVRHRPADGLLQPDPDATMEMPALEALEDASASYDPADEAVEPPAMVPKAAKSSGSASMLVAAGILLSRIAGLVRARVFAQYFGTSLYADVFAAGLRMPNLLQNLLGEGTLSASFIPVYSELLHQGREKEAGRVAGAIFSLLFAAAAALSLVGVFFAPFLVTIFFPGLEGERHELTVTVTRIIFPMAGILVLSAWSLGILNSHRSFFLPYFAPVLWNAAMIGTLLIFGSGMALDKLVIALAWGALAGGVLQFLVQLPKVLRLNRELRVTWAPKLEGVREAVRNAGPAVMGRGVVQISGYLDYFLASLLAVGALATLQYAQLLYILPVSLFGMAVAAAELPELARQRAEGAEVLRKRASGALERIAFYIVPSFIAMTVLGDVVVATLFQAGGFKRADTLVVWLTLVGFSIGLLATTASRLLSSTFFALRDTKTPARYAIVRVVLSVVLSVGLMLQFEAVNFEKLGFQIPGGLWSDVTIGGKPLGTVGLALGGGIAAWVEWWLLKRSLRGTIGPVGAGAGPLLRMFISAGAGAAAAYGLRFVVPPDALLPIFRGAIILGAFGVVYFGVAAALGLEQSTAIFRRVKGMAGRR